MLYSSLSLVYVRPIPFDRAVKAKQKRPFPVRHKLNNRLLVYWQMCKSYTSVSHIFLIRLGQVADDYDCYLSLRPGRRVTSPSHW